MGVSMAKANAPRTSGSKELLDRFSGDEELLAKHGVTEEELELLKTVSLFGNLSSARDIAFILKNIRGTKPTR
jgi:hypothetical protein